MANSVNDSLNGVYGPSILLGWTAGGSGSQAGTGTNPVIGDANDE